MRRKIAYIILALLITGKYCISQNLVLNPSFEEFYVDTGYFCYSIENAKYWYNPTIGTPDYQNNTYWPYVAEPLSGNANIGVFCFYLLNPDWREYAQGTLSTPLISNRLYEVSYYVNITYNNSNEPKYIVNNVGVYFSDDSIRNYSDYFLHVTPQMVNPNDNILWFTGSYILVSGYYKASGGEKYISIGNFFDDEHTDTILYNPSGGPISYFYIDDVSVVEVPAPLTADAGKDSTICLGDSVVLGSFDSTGYHYHWQPNPYLSDTANAKPVVRPLSTTTFYLALIDVVGDTTYDSVTITVRDCDTLPLPAACAGRDTVICKGQPARIGSPGIAGYHYQWQPNQYMNDPANPYPLVYPLSSSTFYLLAIDTRSDTTYDSVTINVNECDTNGTCGCNTEPNAFTPNGDGVNDVYRVVCKGVASFEAHILNRWGNTLFEWNDPEQGWDGKYNGTECSEGVYFCLVRVSFVNGTSSNWAKCLYLKR